MCGRRGLEGDDQLFEMLLTREFRTHYDKIVTPLRGDGLSHAQAGEECEGVCGVTLVLPPQVRRV